MKLIQLSKKETKELEYDSTRFENIAQYELYDSLKELNNNATIWHDIISWAHSYNLDINKVKGKWKKLTELFNCKPNYYVNYEYRNAVWGFNTDYGKIIIYNSLKGTSIQVQHNFDKTKIREFIVELRKLLCKDGIGNYSRFLIKERRGM